jgi:perosamine synthetase
VIDALNQRQVPSRTYFSPIHLRPFYRERFGFCEGDFPVAERVAGSTRALPFYSNIAHHDMEYVAESLQWAIARSRV